MSDVPLLTVNETFVYKIPPLKGSGGHRASDWDLGKPAMTGILIVSTRISGKDASELTVVSVYFQAPNGDRKLFAQCPIKLSEDKSKPPVKP